MMRLGNECRFLDGPAEGARLSLNRSPVVLRVTQSEKTMLFDALDQFDDVAQPHERIFVYVRVGGSGYIHINTRGKPGGGVFRPADYRVLPQQPADSSVRQNDTWRAWVEANKAALQEIHEQFTRSANA